MGDTPAKPRPTSVAGGAHYHAVAATEAFKTYVAGVQKVATHTAAERARRSREEQGRTSYAEATKAQQK